MTSLNTASVVARCEAAGATSNAYVGRVYVTTAPAPTSPDIVLPKPYILVHPKQGVDEITRFTGPPTVEHPEFTLHVVGDTASSVETVMANLKVAFNPAGFGIPPVISGRRNSAGYWRVPVPIQTDMSVTPWLMFGVIELGWRSDPA